MAVHPPWEFIFGILGIICSFLVCLSRLEPIYLIRKKKTSEGFQGIPHVIALFSAMLRLLYAFFQKDTCLLNTINYVTSFFMEIGYLAVYLFYATKKDWDLTCKFILFNIFGFGLIACLTLFLTQGEARVEVLGWVFSLCVVVEPLFIVIPNILGFIFGILQMVLYLMYRNSKKRVIEAKLTKLNEHIVDVEKNSPAICNV